LIDLQDKIRDSTRFLYESGKVLEYLGIQEGKKEEHLVLGIESETGIELMEKFFLL